MSELTTTKQDIRSLLSNDKFKEQLALAMPNYLTPERFSRILLTSMHKTPKLFDCSITSLRRCAMDCASIGLEPDGRHAHLIPYGTECTLIIDYKGIIKLVKDDPDVVDVNCFTIRANDSAIWTNGEIVHTYDILRPRGEVVATYTAIVWKSGERTTGEPFTKEDAELARKKSKSGNNGPWKDWYTEMWKKSNVRRDSKMWNLCPKVRDALEKDDDRLEERPANGRVIARTEPIDRFSLPEPQEEPEETEPIEAE